MDLLPELAPVAEILEFALSERLRPALGLRSELVGEVYGMTSEELNDALSLVSATLASPAVSSIIDPKPVTRG